MKKKDEESPPKRQTRRMQTVSCEISETSSSNIGKEELEEQEIPLADKKKKEI